jgi:hypothetical protein
VSGPGQQVQGHGGEAGPDAVVDDAVGGQVGQPAGFEVADDAFGSASLAVAGFEDGGVADGVTDARGVAPAVEVVEQESWAPGWGRSRRTINRVPLDQADRLISAVRS